jgi:hypothetical protein
MPWLVRSSGDQELRHRRRSAALAQRSAALTLVIVSQSSPSPNFARYATAAGCSELNTCRQSTGAHVQVLIARRRNTPFRDLRVRLSYALRATCTQVSRQIQAL